MFRHEGGRKAVTTARRNHGNDVSACGDACDARPRLSACGLEMEEEGLDLRALGGLIGLLGQPESGAPPTVPAQFPEVEDALMAAQQTAARVSSLPRF